VLFQQSSPEIVMNRFEEIRDSLTRLSEAERDALITWLLRQSADRVEEARPAYATPLPELMTRDEFLELEVPDPIRYEFVNGIIRLMSGPSVAHCRIVQNAYAALRAHLRGGPCVPFCTGGNVKLSPGTDEIVYKPDVFVSCDQSAWDEKSIPNPKFVVEVLSPSTEQIDRKEKAVNYRRTPSMEEYVIASQTRAELTIYRRAARWLPEIVNGLEAVTEFRSLGVSVPLSVIYEDALRELARC
jgi:Uma2 family endonuclease